MKVGEKVVIYKTTAGLYVVEATDKEHFVGNAASTIIVLARTVFLEEACAEDADAPTLD